MVTAQDSLKGGHASAVAQNLLILLAAAIFSLPYLIHGLAPTGDSTLHATYQYQFSRQFWNGDIYPRWMVSANKGYGSPVFLIQYPLPYWITALLRPLTRFAPAPTREARELGVYCFLILAGAGINARLWFRKHYTAFAATVAAIIYISLPFLLPYELYTDFALGQFTTFVWVPLALLACDSLQLSFTKVTALGAVWALLIFSNFMTTLLFLPLIVGYAIARSESNHASLAKCIVSIILSISIGIGLTAIYTLPFFAYLKLFNIGPLLSLPGYELSHSLSYMQLSSMGDPKVVIALLYAVLVALIAARFSWRARGNRALRVTMLLTLGLGVLMATPGLGTKLIALAGLKPPVFRVVDYYPERLLEMALLTFALGVFAYGQVAEQSVRRPDYTLMVLLVTACGAFMLMLAWSAFFWKAFPIIARGIQFPLRLGMPLTVAVAGLLAAAVDSCLRRTGSQEEGRPVMLMAFMVIAVIAGGVFTWRVDRTWRGVLQNPPLVQPDESPNVDHTYRIYVSQDHLAAFANLTGAVPSHDQVQIEDVEAGAARLSEGQGVVTVARQSPRKLLVSYTVSGEARARIGLVYSPLWKIERLPETSGNPIVSSSPDGLVEVSLPPGRHELELVFDVGWPERYGTIVSILSLLVVIGGVLAHLALSRAHVRHAV